MDFLPRDVMLARYLLSSRVRLFVCLSVTIRYCIETTGRIELQASFHLSYTVLYVKDTDKEECLRPFIHIGLDWMCYEEIGFNHGTALRNLVPNSGL